MLAAVYHKVDHGEYSHTLKWENRFFLGLNAAKITNYIKKRAFGTPGGSAPTARYYNS